MALVGAAAGSAQPFLGILPMRDDPGAGRRGPLRLPEEPGARRRV